MSGPGPGPATVGVDVGCTKVLAVLVDGDGAVVAQRRRAVPHDPGTRPHDRGRGRPAAADDAVVAAVAEEVRALVAEAGGRGLAVAAVGAGFPGLVTAAGTVVASPHLPGTDGVDAAGALRGALGLPVAVDNDATCATLAEWRLGAARGCDDALLVAVGTGIGAGVVAAGRLVRGAHGFAGEVGHMVVDPDGPPCPCGRRGCWERYASGEALGRAGRDAAAAGAVPAVTALAGGDPAAVRGEHVTAAAAAGDGPARALVAELARWLALGIANLLAALDSERVVLAGGMVEAGADLLGPLAGALARPGAMGRGRPPVALVGAELGSRAGAVGAALLARRSIGGGTGQAAR